MTLCCDIRCSIRLRSGITNETLPKQNDGQPHSFSSLDSSPNMSASIVSLPAKLEINIESAFPSLANRTIFAATQR